MNPVFQTIRFGPFHTDYHRSVVDEDFKEALSRFLEAELLPQVNEPFDITEGELVADYNNERFCGPNNAVRDAYQLSFRLVRASGADEISLHIYRAKTGEFRLHKDVRQELNGGVQEVFRKIQTGEPGPWACPHCDSELGLGNTPEMFDLGCRNGCFTMSYHKDPATGRLAHGHYFAPLNLKAD